MQTHNVVSRVNVHNLRPIFHRLLTSRSRVLNVDNTRGIPPDALHALEKTRGIMDGPVELHIHRMVPFESTDPGIKEVIAVLCIARENASGGFIMTKNNKVELFPGQFTVLPTDPCSWYVSAVGEMNAFEDTFVDVVWCSRSF
jgi:hypothetical protein